MQTNINNDCAHCLNWLGLEYPLYEDDLFWVVCDAHPLIEWHILIIPKEHVPAMWSLKDEEFTKYEELYKKVKRFVTETYWEVWIFEHWIVGQTVFHAHTHFLPFDYKTEDIIPDKNNLKIISNLEEIRNEFKKFNKYLYFDNKNELYLVNTEIWYPRFFRDIFASLLNAKERADRKKTRENEQLMKQFKIDRSILKEKWDNFFS